MKLRQISNTIGCRDISILSVGRTSREEKNRYPSTSSASRNGNTSDHAVAFVGASMTCLTIASSLLIKRAFASPEGITIFDPHHELVPDSRTANSGLLLWCNGLSILDSLSVLHRITPWSISMLWSKGQNERDETIEKAPEQ